MNNLVDLLFLLLGWLLLDFFGIMTLCKPIILPRQWKINVKSLIKKKYTIISFVIELISIISLIISFSLPWYYHHYVGFGGDQIRNFYIRDAKNLDDLLLSYIYYAYLIGLIVIFVKISVKKKIHGFNSLELIEVILVSLGLVFIININFITCDEIFLIPEISCVNCGYSTGFYLFTVGLIIFIINGLQMSIYSRLKRDKKLIL